MILKGKPVIGKPALNSGPASKVSLPQGIIEVKLPNGKIIKVPGPRPRRTM